MNEDFTLNPLLVFLPDRFTILRFSFFTRTLGLKVELLRLSRVGGVEELAHEAEAGLADVGAAGEHVEDGVDGAAEVSEGCDVGAPSEGGGDHRRAALQQAGHLEDGEGGQEEGGNGKKQPKLMNKNTETWRVHIPCSVFHQQKL